MGANAIASSFLDIEALTELLKKINFRIEHNEIDILHSIILRTNSTIL